jgi:hypothetical protein
MHLIEPLPDRLDARLAVALAAEETADFCDQAYYLVQGRRRARHLNFASRCAPRISSGSKNNAASRSGQLRPLRIRYATRQATTMNRASARSKRSMADSCSSSTSQPFFSTLPLSATIQDSYTFFAKVYNFVKKSIVARDVASPNVNARKRMRYPSLAKQSNR